MALAAHKKKPLGSGGIVDYEGLWGIEEIFVACDKYNELAAFAVPFFKIFSQPKPSNFVNPRRNQGFDHKKRFQTSSFLC
jgi:hypothetical protein